MRISASKKQPAVTALLFATLVIIVCCSSSLPFFFLTTVAAAESINNDDDEPNNKNNGRPQSAGDNNDSNNGHNARYSTPTNNDSQQYSSPLLDSNSVVLITGAAGFIGHELSLALKRTYNVKKLLLVDHLGMESDNEGVFHGPPPKNDNGDASYKTKKAYEKYDSDRMSLFELKRQRIFRVFHELTAVSHDLDDTDVIRDQDELQNYNNIESIKFYRADMRPSIPEFFDIGELPLLEGIFGSNPDITHVVHLADDDINNQNQAIPRNRGSAKAGRMEAILEEMRLILERKAAAEASSDDVNSEGLENGAARLPQLVYASSYEVYDFLSTATKPEYSAGQQHQPNPPPFREDKPITTPSSLHGASKLIDEVLASAYHSTHGIFSVGLRFFPVYGPWSNPGTDVFDLAQELYSQNRGADDVENNAAKDDFNRFHEDIKDYVYIDDAVDAIMSAMQYRPLGNPPPVVFNVGTGKGSTLKEIRDEIMIHFPPGSFNNDKSPPKHSVERQATISYASTERSKDLLGFETQIPLSVGIARTLSWLRDHSDPFGNDDSEVLAKQKTIDSFLDNSLTKVARDECSPFDRECLRGTPVFPCASECSKTENCTPSAWDDVASLSRLVTRGCDAVMFTILLDKDADQIPSVVGATASASFVGADLPDDNAGKRTKARCNIAFVSEDTPLVQRLRTEGDVYSDETDGSLPSMIRHGFWTLIPVKSASSDDWLHTFSRSVALSSLPKISPGQFFGPSVRYAVFVGPSVLIDDVPQLLTKLRAESSATDSDVAMIVTERRQACDASVRGSICPWTMPENNDSIQRNMHNMVRVALKGDMLGGGLGPIIDSSFIAHSLHGEEARMLRCDVYSEAIQWGASSDERSLEFILSLHDFWSRAGNHWSSAEIESLETGSSLNTEEDSRLMVLSSSDRQFFAHIATQGSMGIIHL